jgi:drug/metabolite transporter (DMT)-like permease
MTRTRRGESVRWGYLIVLLAFFEVLLIGGSFAEQNSASPGFRALLIGSCPVGLPIGIATARKWGAPGDNPKPGRRPASRSTRYWVATVTVAIATALYRLVLQPLVSEEPMVAIVGAVVPIAMGYCVFFFIRAIRMQRIA